MPENSEREYQEQYKSNEEPYWSQWHGMFLFKFSWILKLFERILILRRVRKSKLFSLDLTHVMNGEGKWLMYSRNDSNRHKNGKDKWDYSLVIP